jgi:hypothetical protein
MLCESFTVPDPKLSFHLLGGFAVLGRIWSLGESGVATRLGRMAYGSKSSSACSILVD